MLTVVEKGDVVVEAKFGRPSVVEQLRVMAARLEAGEWPEPEALVLVMAYTEPTQNMVCLAGGTEDMHPYFMAGVLQNAALTCLDNASFAAEGLDIEE